VLFRSKPNDELDVMAKKVIKKPKKVKPNYKRKLATERDKVKKKYGNKKR
ncbi:DEAD/DEAH box helicase, partial [Bacillus sp. OA1]|nr:DEAD/DEAH box helicase [Bacillus sp. OA1]